MSDAPRIVLPEDIAQFSRRDPIEPAEHHAETLAEAIRNGGCPNCGTSVGIIHTDQNGGTYRQCRYCGDRYDTKMPKQEGNEENVDGIE